MSMRQSRMLELGTAAPALRSLAHLVVDRVS